MSDRYSIKIGFARYTESLKGKMRPFLVFQDKKTNRTALWRITSKYVNKSSYYRRRYFPLFHWFSYGLKEPSFVDIGSQLNLTNQQYASLKISKQPSISHLTIQDQIQFVEFLEKLK